MLHHAKLFISFFILSGFCLSQSVDVINISGNRVFSKSDIEIFAGIYRGMPFDFTLTDSVKQRIAMSFAERGYHNAVIEDIETAFSSDSLKVNFDIRLKEGEPTIVSKVHLNISDSALVRNIASFFRHIEGRIFNKFEIEESFLETITFLENNGYPFTRVIVESVHLFNDPETENKFAELFINLDKGSESRIDKIEIRGNSSTKDYVIIRELRLEAGELYSQKRIEKLPRRLNRLRFFEPVRTPDFYFNSQNEGILLVEVKERQTNNFDGVIGYVPGRGDNEKGFITGLVNISLRNLFGTGRAAAIRWHQFDRYSQEMELKYLEPWLLGYPFNISTGFFQRKQDTTYVQRKVEGALEFLATEDISAAVFIASESVIPTENVIPRFTVYNSTSFTTGLSLKIDTRDDPFAPTEGLLFITSYSFSRKKISGPLQFITPELKLKVNYQRITLGLSAFYEIFQNNVIAASVHGRELRGEQFEDSDLFRLGGTNSLRGYREEQFLGSRILWSNLEYRLLLTRRSYAFLFFDTGYFLRDEDTARSIPKNEGFRIGYGLGLTIETGLGILGVSFALAKGDSFSDGKIHFGLLNEF